MMETKRAVLFVDDAEGELIRKPLMLQNVLFCPVLTWLSTALREQGVERFFVCCPASYQEEALACFSSAEQVTVSDNRADLLAFLEGEEETLVVPGAAVMLLSGPTRLWWVSTRSALMWSALTRSACLPCMTRIADRHRVPAAAVRS